MAKILQAVKKMTKIYQVFLFFWGFRAYIGCLGCRNRMGCVWEQTEHWLPRYARLKVGGRKGGKQ